MGPGAGLHGNGACGEQVGHQGVVDVNKRPSVGKHAANERERSNLTVHAIPVHIGNKHSLGRVHKPRTVLASSPILHQR